MTEEKNMGDVEPSQTSALDSLCDARDELFERYTSGDLDDLIAETVYAKHAELETIIAQLNGKDFHEVSSDLTNRKQVESAGTDLEKELQNLKRPEQSGEAGKNLCDTADKIIELGKSLLSILPGKKEA
jgi:hypothetical protein